MATKQLRVLVGGGDTAAFHRLSTTVGGLGHETLPHAVKLTEIGKVSAAERPDLAIMIVQDESQSALNMIKKVVHEAVCPVIALLDVEDREFINQAATQGIFAYITGGEDPAELQSSIDIVLRRFAEYHDLEGAFARRAVTERAKGILMERHRVDERAAFNLLRDEARRNNRKVVDIAEAILTSHALLPRGDSGDNNGS
jgi:response regulator NasT